MKQSIGIDIIEIDRIGEAIKKYNNKFLDKIFTTNEINYCISKSKPEQHFAARFAVKEAVIKAIGKNNTIFYKNIETSNDLDGKPFVKINSKVIDNINISISHSRDYAVCIALIQN